MKYEFEIRGEFEEPIKANVALRMDYIKDIMQGALAYLGGHVTNQQLAMKGKLQEKPLVVREFVEENWEIGLTEFYNNSIIVNLNRKEDD